MKTLGTISTVGLLAACVLLSNPWCARAGNADKQRSGGDERRVRFAVMSDPHLYNPRLGTTGSAFDTYLSHDPKLLKESEAILESALESIIQQRVKFLIISGDLTKDGE